MERVIRRKNVRLIGKLQRDEASEQAKKARLLFVDSGGRVFKVKSNELDRRLSEYLDENMVVEGVMDIFKRRNSTLKINYFKVLHNERKETQQPTANIGQAS